MAKINKEKEAALPLKRLQEVLSYDKDTGVFVNLVNRNSRAIAGQVAGNVNNKGYVRITIDGYIYAAHRLAWLFVHGEFPQGEGEPFIDHINGDKADNRIENLRVSSTAANQRNMKKFSTNISGATGVNLIWKMGGSKVNPKIYWYWRASWHDENGKQQGKDFPVHTYGEVEAERLAIYCRTEQIHLLELNHNIKYSERHGVCYNK